MSLLFDQSNAEAQKKKTKQKKTRKKQKNKQTKNNKQTNKQKNKKKKKKKKKLENIEIAKVNSHVEWFGFFFFVYNNIDKLCPKELPYATFLLTEATLSPKIWKSHRSSTIRDTLIKKCIHINTDKERVMNPRDS